MRGAPPVRMLCGPDVRWHRVQQLILGASAATAAGWGGWQLDWDRGAIVACAALGGLLASMVVRRQRRAAVLEWTGEAWQLNALTCRPRVRVELGNWLLLDVRSDSGRHWLPLDLTHCGAPPHLVRAALVAHARPGAEPREAGRGV